jgi:hypothetical protein
MPDDPAKYREMLREILELEAAIIKAKKHNQSLKTSTCPEPKQTEIPDVNLIPELLQCTICLNRAVDATFVPCGHTSTCHDCAGTWFKMNNCCPTCRGQVSEVMRIFIG